MKKNKSNLGFTMIELLAAIVILGLLMMVAVPTVMSILRNQKNTTYVEDGIRLASNMDYKMRSDNSMNVPARGACIAMSLAYMDNNTFNEAPNDGEYDRDSSFVVAFRNTNASSDDDYIYYIRLIEKTKSGSYRGVNLEKLDDLYKDNAKDKAVVNIGQSKVIPLANYVSNKQGLINELASYGVNCSSIEIYAPVSSGEVIETPDEGTSGGTVGGESGAGSSEASGSATGGSAAGGSTSGGATIGGSANGGTIGSAIIGGGTTIPGGIASSVLGGKIIASGNGITVVDRSADYCAPAMENYYGPYCFNCIKSGSIIVIVNGVEYNIKQALTSGVVTVDELKAIGFTPITCAALRGGELATY